MYKSAHRFLDQMGMLDLEKPEELDYVIGESTGKYTRQSGCCSLPVPTYRQIHIHGPKKPKKKTVTATAAPAA
jgi:hypothetical protein